MDIIKEIEDRYKSAPTYGVQFSIEPDAYKVSDNKNVTFGKNVTELCCGTFYNYQDVIISGKVFGFLEESKSDRLFDPMCTSFCYCIADCQDENYEEVYEKYKNNPHFSDAGESLLLRFATLVQFLQFHAEMVARSYAL